MEDEQLSFFNPFPSRPTSNGSLGRNLLTGIYASGGGLGWGGAKPLNNAQPFQGSFSQTVRGPNGQAITNTFQGNDPTPAWAAAFNSGASRFGSQLDNQTAQRGQDVSFGIADLQDRGATNRENISSGAGLLGQLAASRSGLAGVLGSSALQAGGQLGSALYGTLGQLGSAGAQSGASRFGSLADLAGTLNTNQTGLQGIDLSTLRNMLSSLGVAGLGLQGTGITAAGGVEQSRQARAASDLQAMLNLQGRDLESSRALQQALGVAGIGANSALGVAGLGLQGTLAQAAGGVEQSLNARRAVEREAELALQRGDLESARALMASLEQSRTGLEGTLAQAGASRFGSEQDRASREFEAQRALEASLAQSGAQRFVGSESAGAQRFTAEQDRMARADQALRQLQGIQEQSSTQRFGIEQDASTRALEAMLGLQGIDIQSLRQSQTALGTAGIGRESAREVAELGLTGTQDTNMANVIRELISGGSAERIAGTQAGAQLGVADISQTGERLRQQRFGQVFPFITRLLLGNQA